MRIGCAYLSIAIVGVLYWVSPTLGIAIAATVLVAVIAIAVTTWWRRVHAPYRCAYFSEDGRIVALNRSHIVRKIDPNGRRAKTLRRPPRRMHSSALCADGSHVLWAVQNTDGAGIELYVVEVDAANPIREMGADGYFSSLVLGPKGEVFGYLDDDEIRLWDAKTGSECAWLDHLPKCKTVAFSKNGAYLAVAQEDSVRIFDLASGELAQAIANLSDPSDVALSDDGLLLAVSTGSSLEIWDVRSGKRRQSVESIEPANPSFHPTGAYVVFEEYAGGDWHLACVDSLTGNRLWTSSLKWTIEQAPSFSPEGDQIVAVSDQGLLYRWLIDEHCGFLGRDVLTHRGWTPS